MENPSKSWRIHTSTIARALYREDLAGHLLFGKKIPVEQGEAAVWLSQGEVLKIVTQGQAIQASAKQRLKDLFSSSQEMTVLMLDTTDIMIHFRIGIERMGLPGPAVLGNSPETEEAGKEEKTPEPEPAKRSPITTKDGKSLIFDTRLTLNLRLEKANQIFSLMEDCRSLEKEDLCALCRKKLEDELFGPAIAEQTAKNLFSDLDTLAGLSRAAGDGLAAFLSENGLHMERLAMNPALSEEERADLVSVENEYRESEAALSKQRQVHDLEKDFDRMVLRDRLAVALENAILENDTQQQKLLKAAFIFEKKKELEAARIEDKIERIRQETAHAAREKEEQLKLHGIERSFEVESKRMRLTAELEMDQMRALAEEHRKNKAHKSRIKMEEMQARHTRAIAEKEHVERLLEIGAREGVLNGDLIKEAIRHETLRKALDEGGASARAFADAEARRASAEQFKKGLEHQSAARVPGSPDVVLIKQETVLPGQGALPGNGAPNEIRQITGPSDAQPVEGTVMTICPTCGKEVPDDAVFCGYCGNKILEQNP